MGQEKQLRKRWSRKGLVTLRVYSASARSLYHRHRYSPHTRATVSDPFIPSPSLSHSPRQQPARLRLHSWYPSEEWCPPRLDESRSKQLLRL